MSECQYPFGMYCSSIRQVIAIQYTIKIILGEYFNSLLRLVSNFTYLAFCLCRMHKVGKEHGKLVAFMNELSVKIYMIVWVLISAGLSVCKALQFDINKDMPSYAYPVLIIQNSSRMWLFKSGYVAVTVINAIYDLINYFVFVLIHFVVDLVLIKKMRRVIREKEEKLKEMKPEGLERTLKQNKESKRRLVFMVAFSSVFNIVTKLPSMITSLNDVRLVFIKLSESIAWFVFDSTATTLSFRFFCSNQKTCMVFQRFGSCLFLLSLCSTLHFLKRFDKNFKLAFKQAFQKKS